MRMAATEFKAKCLEMLDRVNRTGGELVISKHGKPVARLIGEHDAKPWLALRW
jgi:prevent-host-death family protein